MEIEKSPEVTRATLLEKVNNALEALGSKARWKRAPEFLESYEPLRGKILVMVDDVREVLESFAPHLITATDGSASFIEYKGQKLNELLDQILQYNPNIVLLDYHLSDQLKGTEVSRALHATGFTGESIGFSSDPSVTREFEDSDATGCIDKNASYPEESVQKLAQLISKKV